MVRGIVVGAFQENCWVIGNRRTGEAICVDPGDEPGEILAMARDMGVTIKYIANSHGHIDHVLGVAGVRDVPTGTLTLRAGVNRVRLTDPTAVTLDQLRLEPRRGER